MAEVISHQKRKNNLIRNKIPDEIIKNEELNKDISDLLPSNYSFEIHKTVWFIIQKDAKYAFLQFPEGLLIFACRIASIIEKFTKCEVIISSDIVYGACCVDDFAAKLLGASVLIHYGHSCLYPIQDTPYSYVLYVFVEIAIDINHFVISVRDYFSKISKLSFVSTVQFVGSLHKAVNQLVEAGYNASIEQSRPLTKGEILGCTSPNLAKDVDALIYLGDGRFHIESAMIQNNSIKTYRYDPYNKVLSLESYHFDKMVENRNSSIVSCMLEQGTFGIILGTLGRQGSLKVMQSIENNFKKAGRCDLIKILVSEITPQLIENLLGIDAFVQIACPRLSIDWGSSYSKPLLTPYESAVLTKAARWDSKNYPMDYYAKISLGPWTPNHLSKK